MRDFAINPVSREGLRHHLVRRARWLVLVCAIGLALPSISAILAGSSGTFAWLVDLAGHWQWLYLTGLVLACTVAALNDRRWALPLLGVWLPWLTASDPAPSVGQDQIPGDKVLTVASANVHLGNRDIAPLIRWISKVNPDVLILHEVSPDYAEGLNKLDGYQFRRLAPSRDPFGMGVLSRFPFTQSQVVVGADGIQHIEAQIDWNGQPIGLTAWHPMPPISPHDHGMRNRQLRALAQASEMSGQPAIVAGDLNATPWSSAFSGLDQAGLRRATGLTPTWPAAGRGSMGIPIDHVLVTKHWRVIGRKLGPNLGSDHMPVMVSIGLLEETDQHAK
jgi:endonuclease/exonuclease/phosphatase (EEP) superfamily protein YafD